MNFNCNLLMTVVTVTNQLEEDAIEVEVQRDDVFRESLFHPSLRNAFNSDLRRLRDLEFVTLTRKTVSLTQKGFDEAWS